MFHPSRAQPGVMREHGPCVVHVLKVSELSQSKNPLGSRREELLPEPLQLDMASREAQNQTLSQQSSNNSLIWSLTEDTGDKGLPKLQHFYSSQGPTMAFSFQTPRSLSPR